MSDLSGPTEEASIEQPAVDTPPLTPSYQTATSPKVEIEPNPDPGFDAKYCSGCGIKIHKSAPLCPKCGAPQADVKPLTTRPEKSRVVAIVLALFLGGLGAHKFYLGKPGWGIVYVLFFWTFIPAIVALIELLIYLFTSDEAFHREYG